MAPPLPRLHDELSAFPLFSEVPGKRTHPSQCLEGRHSPGPRAVCVPTLCHALPAWLRRKSGGLIPPSCGGEPGSPVLTWPGQASRPHCAVREPASSGLGYAGKRKEGPDQAPGSPTPSPPCPQSQDAAKQLPCSTVRAPRGHGHAVSSAKALLPLQRPEEGPEAAVSSSRAHQCSLGAGPRWAAPPEPPIHAAVVPS